MSVSSHTSIQIKVFFPPPENQDDLSALYLEETGDPVEIEVCITGKVSEIHLLVSDNFLVSAPSCLL